MLRENCNLVKVTINQVESVAEHRIRLVRKANGDVVAKIDRANVAMFARRILADVGVELDLPSVRDVMHLVNLKMKSYGIESWQMSEKSKRQSPQ